MSQEYKERAKSKSAEAETIDENPPKVETSSTADIDSILDEIDEVLEVNAEEFVKGFIQKGGQ